MKALLDTCTFIWLCAEPDRLSDAAARILDDTETTLLVSDVCAMEIALKWTAGKLTLPDSPRTWVESQAQKWSVEHVPLSREHIYRATELADHHRDPFDRLLVATALTVAATIITPDTAIHSYPVSWRW
ncbi:MAG: PIN domain-containing protein [Spirochaetes bacterium]|jgi:PIN domain nuclease of toxin-antitoxin system|nr:PIN domain-containing protein [Spirochaetota bacterium]